MIDSKINSKKGGERSLATENIFNMLNIIRNTDKIITIFDRGYISVEMLLMLLDTPIKYLFRLPTTTFKKEQQSMKSNDEIVEIVLTTGRLSNIDEPIIKQRGKDLKTLKVRIVKITLNTGEVECLLTNLFDEKEFSTKEIGELYYERWGIEQAFDVIKNKLNIENISGRKRLIVEQDFYAQMLVFNMAEDLRRDANNKLEPSKKSDLKYDYKVNLNLIMITLNSTKLMTLLSCNTILYYKEYEFRLQGKV
ncbi:transposase [Clostridium gasigenes]|nr:transposase [Clostridium gasigenes]